MTYYPGSGGGSGSVSTSSDVALNNPTNSEVLTYDGAIGKWINSAVPATSVADGSVSTAKLADAAVTDAKIASGISLSKLATDPLSRQNHSGTQAPATITGLEEYIQNTIATMFANGAHTNITVTYDPTLKTLSLANSTADVAVTRIRAGDFNAGDFSEWADLSTPAVLPRDTATVTIDSTTKYEGTYGAKAFIPAGDGNKYARTIWGTYSDTTATYGNSLGLGDGSDFYYGMAVFLPTGFNAAVQSYISFMRWDDYTDAVSRPWSLGGIAGYKNGSQVEFFLMRENIPNDPQTNLLGTATFTLAENTWHWVEVRQKLSQTDGQAINELWINGSLFGSSTARNYYGQPIEVIKYGIVAINDTVQTNAVTLHFDRCSIHTGGKLGQ